MFSFLPYGGRNRYRLSRRELKKPLLALLFILAGISLLAWEVPFFSNTFGVRWLLLLGFLLGLVLGSWLAWKIARQVNDITERTAVFLTLCLPFCIFTPPTLHWLNRHIPLQSPEPRQVNILDVFPDPEKRRKGEKPYVVHFLWNGQPEKCKMMELPKDLQMGSAYDLPVGRGLIGFEYVALPAR